MTVARRGLAAVAVLLTLTGCQWRFGVAGDSVTFDARDELEDRGALVRSFGGVSLASAGRPAVRVLARAGFDEIVVALGLNDVAYGATPAELERRVRGTMRDDLDGVGCVVWVDLKTSSNVHDDWPARAGQFNEILRRVVPAYGGHVAAWSRHAAAHPTWFRSDGIHLTGVGQVGYAAFVNAARLSFCG